MRLIQFVLNNTARDQARTGPAGYREIPGGPMDRWAGGQQNYYDTKFWCPLILSIVIKTWLFIKSCNDQKSLMKNHKNLIVGPNIPFYFKCDVYSHYNSWWTIQFFIKIFAVFVPNDKIQWIKYNFNPTELFRLMIIGLSGEIFIGN